MESNAVVILHVAENEVVFESRYTPSSPEKSINHARRRTAVLISVTRRIDADCASIRLLQNSVGGSFTL
jgi:hypothetical protein